VRQQNPIDYWLTHGKTCNSPLLPGHV
jgi:hypothetical protein